MIINCWSIKILVLNLKKYNESMIIIFKRVKKKDLKILKYWAITNVFKLNKTLISNKMIAQIEMNKFASLLRK
jgi:hypothetical protein